MSATRPPKRLVTPRTSSSGPRQPRGGAPSRAAQPAGDGLRRAAAAALATATGLVRRRVDGRRPHAAPAQALGPQQHTSDQAQAEEEPAPQREVDGGQRRRCRCERPIQRTKVRHLREQDAVEERDQHRAEDHARRLPVPPSTTMHSSMIETWNSKAPGVMAWSLAA